MLLEHHRTKAGWKKGCYCKSTDRVKPCPADSCSFLSGFCAHFEQDLGLQHNYSCLSCSILYWGGSRISPAVETVAEGHPPISTAWTRREEGHFPTQGTSAELFLPLRTWGLLDCEDTLRQARDRRRHHPPVSLLPLWITSQEPDAVPKLSNFTES